MSERTILIGDAHEDARMNAHERAVLDACNARFEDMMTRHDMTEEEIITDQQHRNTSASRLILAVAAWRKWKREQGSHSQSAGAELR